MDKYFWNINGEVCHIVETVEPAENPCGNDGQRYIAYCTEKGNSWTMKIASGRIIVNDEEVAKFNKPICPICWEIRTNIKVQKAILSH